MFTRTITLPLVMPRSEIMTRPGSGLATGNTAVGAQALFSNVDGSFNDAVGAFALLDNTDGFGNNAFGDSALFSNVVGVENTALGDVALAFNDSMEPVLANNNTAVGGAALFNNVDGSENTAVGAGAGPNVVTGVNNTYVGDFVGTLAADESNTIRIGDLSNGNGAGSLECFIGGIFNNFQPVGSTVVEVTLDLSNDHLGWDVGPNQGGSAPVQRGAPALVAHRNLASVPSSSTKLCSMTKLRSWKQRSRSNRKISKRLSGVSRSKSKRLQRVYRK